MKLWHAIIVLVGAILLVAIFNPTAFRRARAYRRPGIQENLFALEVAKARWAAAHKGGGEWPTMKEVLPYLTNGSTIFGGGIHPRNQEIYIVNKVGAPVYAYDPVTEKLLSLRSNLWPLIEQMKE